MSAIGEIVEYSLTPGSRVPVGLVPAIAKELEQFTGDARLMGVGEGASEYLVRVAASLEHPLHNFIYDKSERGIAEEYYLLKARELIRAVQVEIVVQGRPRQTATVRSMVFSKSMGSYVAVARTLTEADLRVERVEVALSELESWMNRFGMYGELAPIVSAIGRLIAKNRGRMAA